MANERDEREKQLLKAQIRQVEARIATLEQQLDDRELLNPAATEKLLQESKQLLIGLRFNLDSMA